MNKELILIIKELKKNAHTRESCIASQFIGSFTCLEVECRNCALSRLKAKHRYSNQIVLVNL